MYRIKRSDGMWLNSVRTDEREAFEGFDDATVTSLINGPMLRNQSDEDCASILSGNSVCPSYASALEMVRKVRAH